MPEPARTSPFAATGLNVSVPGPEPVTLRQLPFRGKLVLRGDEGVQANAAACLGVQPPPLLGSSQATSLWALRPGPDEWLVLTADADAGTIAGNLRDALRESHHAVVVVSDRMVGIGVSGARARDVLNAGCPLDLHPSVFGPGAATRTLVGKATVVLHRPEADDAFEVWVNGSFAPYLWLFITNAAREFGIAIAT